MKINHGLAKSGVDIIDDDGYFTNEKIVKLNG